MKVFFSLQCASLSLPPRLHLSRVNIVPTRCCCSLRYSFTELETPKKQTQHRIQSRNERERGIRPRTFVYKFKLFHCVYLRPTTDTHVRSFWILITKNIFHTHTRASASSCNLSASPSSNECLTLAKRPTKLSLKQWKMFSFIHWTVTFVCCCLISTSAMKFTYIISSWSTVTAAAAANERARKREQERRNRLSESATRDKTQSANGLGERERKPFS